MDRSELTTATNTPHSADPGWRIFSFVDAITSLTSAMMAGGILILDITVGVCERDRRWECDGVNAMGIQLPTPAGKSRLRRSQVEQTIR